MVSRVRRLTTAAMSTVAALVFSSAGFFVSPTASADGTAEESSDEVNPLAASAVIESVQPAIVTPSTETFTISGTVTNTGSEPLVNLQVLPRWGYSPVADREEVERVFEDPDYPWGPGTGTGQRYDDPVHFAGNVAPGESVAFNLEFDSENFSDPQWFSEAGVYVIGVDVRAGPDCIQCRPTYATPHTTITWIPDDTELPEVPVAMLWPVTAQPSIMPEGEFFDDSLASDLALGGRLNTLVNAAQSTSVPLTWLVDPDVLTTVDAMTDGYRVRSGNDLVEGEGVGDASAWRDAFGTATASGDVHLLPANQPDLEAVHQADGRLAAELADRAVAAAQATAEATTGWESGTAWLDTGTVDAKALALLADAGVETAVVRPSAVSNHATHSSVDVGSGTVSAAVTDAGLDGTFTEDADAFVTAQRWRAETAMIALAAMENGAPVGGLVTAPPQDWSPSPAAASAMLDAWTSADWIRPTSLRQLLADTDAVETEIVERDGEAALPPATVDALTQLDAETDAYLAMVTGADGTAPAEDEAGEQEEPDTAGTNTADSETETAQDYDAAELRAASSSWRGNPDGSLEYSSQIISDLSDALDGVQVIVRDSVTLTSDEGEFPLTIENTLDQTVTVGLDVTSSNSDRLTIDPVPPQVIGPGEKVNVLVSAEAKANGLVPVTVQLVNAEGDPIGPPKETRVNAAEYGTIAWVIVGAAGLLFGAGLVRRVLRGRTQSEKGDNLEASSDEPVEKVAQ